MHQNPVGKSYRQQGQRKNLLKSRRSNPRCQPVIERLAILKFRAWEPLVMFSTITGPTNKVLVTATTLSCIEYFVNEIFVVVIWGGDRRQFFHTARWEKRDIRFRVREDL